MYLVYKCLIASVVSVDGVGVRKSSETLRQGFSAYHKYADASGRF